MIKEKGLPEEIADRIYEYVQLNGMVVDVSNGEMFPLANTSFSSQFKNVLT